MLGLLKKKYKIRIKVKRFFFEKELVFSFNQGTFKENLELFYSIKKGKIYEFLFDFLNKSGKISVRDFNSIPFLEKQRIINFLIDTFAKGFFDKKGKKPIESPPFGSFIVFICEHSNETVDSLLSKTWEQIEFMLEGIIWNLNEQTKEGRNKNKLSQIKKGTSFEEEKKAIKEYFKNKYGY